MEAFVKRTGRRLLTFFGLWGGMFALLAALGSTCPFCGKPGCAGSVASSGFLSGLAAMLTYLPRGFIDWLKRAKHVHQ
jgi:hypothetical protein